LGKRRQVKKSKSLSTKNNGVRNPEGVCGTNRKKKKKKY